MELNQLNVYMSWNDLTQISYCTVVKLTISDLNMNNTAIYHVTSHLNIYSNGVTETQYYLQIGVAIATGTK